MLPSCSRCPWVHLVLNLIVFLQPLGESLGHFDILVHTVIAAAVLMERREGGERKMGRGGGGELLTTSLDVCHSLISSLVSLLTSSLVTRLEVKSLMQSKKQFSVTWLYVARKSLN